MVKIPDGRGPFEDGVELSPDLPRNESLALKREWGCMATNYDEIDSLSAHKPVMQKLTPARLRWRSRGLHCDALNGVRVGIVGSNEGAVYEGCPVLCRICLWTAN